MNAATLTTYTVHLRAHTAPVLVAELFSWAAAVFGPVWLALRSCWIAAVLVLCAEVTVAVATDGALRIGLAVAMAGLLGLLGRDLQRWSLARRGFVLAHVVAGGDGDAALARLLQHRPELVADAVT